jgi:NAD(P)-dependent dehydrogenase (short-subunit alcohol dehydrogenase family)
MLAAEFAPRGIRVNAMTPGAWRIGIWNARAANAVEMEPHKRRAALLPVR